MELKNVTDVDSFFDMINKCEGQVELLSKEGDRLNLKSTLTQFYARELFTGEVEGLEIIAHKPVDIPRIMGFLENKYK